MVEPRVSIHQSPWPPLRVPSTLGQSMCLVRWREIVLTVPPSSSLVTERNHPILLELENLKDSTFLVDSEILLLLLSRPTHSKRSPRREPVFLNLQTPTLSPSRLVPTRVFQRTTQTPVSLLLELATRNLFPVQRNPEIIEQLLFLSLLHLLRKETILNRITTSPWLVVRGQSH